MSYKISLKIYNALLLSLYLTFLSIFVSSCLICCTYVSKIVLWLLLIPKTLYYVDLFNCFLVDFNFKVTGFIFVFSFKNNRLSLLIFKRKFVCSTPIGSFTQLLICNLILTIFRDFCDLYIDLARAKSEASINSNHII